MSESKLAYEMLLCRPPLNRRRSSILASPRPGNAPVRAASRTTGAPFTITSLTPTAVSLPVRSKALSQKTLRVEHNDVGCLPRREETAVREAESAGRSLGDMVHRFLQREKALAAVASHIPGKRPETPRMGETRRVNPVAAQHVGGCVKSRAQPSGDSLATRRLPHQPDRQGVIDKEVADEVDRVCSSLCRSRHEVLTQRRPVGCAQCAGKARVRPARRGWIDFRTQVLPNWSSPTDGL